MNWDAIDWSALARMRAAFLEGSAGRRDYWQRESDLASYDLTFAQRIGWKWDFVLGELQRLEWTPPSGPVVDWGCGSGIAGRAFWGVFPATGVALWDRSDLAMNFAAGRWKERFPNVTVRRGTTGTILLVSHVVTELDDLTEVLTVARAATTVIWVEPGTHAASRRLTEVRRNLPHPIVAPCPHRQECGMLAAGNERHWCHFFAPVPRGIFQDGNWARFGQVAGVDLRSLPVSYLVLDRRETVAKPVARMIGWPRVYKAHARVQECLPTGAVAERDVPRREAPAEFRQWQKRTNP
jgi:hypothetical protein